MYHKYYVVTRTLRGVNVRHTVEVDADTLRSTPSDDWQTFEEIARSLGGELSWYERVEEGV